MGCTDSRGAGDDHVYSVPVSAARQGESEVRRHPKCINALAEFPDPETKTMQDVLYRAVSRYGNKPYLGTQRDVLVCIFSP